MAIRLSFGVWIFTSGLVIIPSLVWVQNQVYSSGQECDLYGVYGDKIGHFMTLRKSAMGIFIFSLIILNSKIVMTIIKRNRSVGVLKGKLNTSTYKPDIKGLLGSKNGTCSSVAGSSVGEPGIKRVLGKKVETRTSTNGSGHNKYLESKLDTLGNVDSGTSRMLKNVLDTSIVVDKPGNNGILESKPQINRVMDGKQDRMFNISVLEPGISGGLTRKIETSSTLDEPGTSHKVSNTNNTENLSLPKRKISKSQVNIKSELESQTIEKRITKDHNQKLKTTTKQRMITSTTYNFLKSKNFKAYLTVLMHVGFHLLSGMPSFVFLSNRQLLPYYTSSRRIRFVCAMCRYLVSLIDPILILLRIPVFRTTLKTLCSKCIQRQPKYY
ncbi:Hypothetical predicted protein [Mytilus galloprovincialis]|uniref:Uncharacterized protein n=1 Tax=Mytilus galloprovincialis TaxID=29158 RepID=A0A8B6DU07_MYTGA|nr:Hypothetical predicted protein [Mytilus galloprovincialis]